MIEEDETGPAGDAVTHLLRGAARPQRDALGRRMKDSVTAALFGDRPEPVKIDRYVLLDRVASGAIGTVVAAYDPQLDRRVALKLLRTRGDEAWRQRLMREAKALARLSHPNVVAVYDAGAHEDEVFLAMELVDGDDVVGWLQASPRAWREVLDVFVQAGRGLAAAHAAGLVHRDVKPANILVGRDGRVRVADFGLSRTRAEADAEVSAPASLVSGGHQLESLTRSGVRVGTPAYMAPEQHEGEPATERSDQFQFCVSLYEALFGRRPFIGRDEDALLAAKRAGPDPPSDPHDVPDVVVAAIRRGLAVDPAARHESMDALLREIAIDPMRPRARSIWVLGGVALVAVAIGVAVSWREAPACTGARARLDGAWDDARRAALQDAFASSGAPHRDQTWQAVAGALDEHAERIVDAQREACEATRVRGEHSEAVLDARSRCIGLRVRELDALVDELMRPDADVMARAAGAPQALASPETCISDVAEAEQPPSAEVQAEHERLVEANARRWAGRYDAALALARDVGERAFALDDDALAAEAQVLVGILHDELGQRAESVTALQEAAVLARSSARPLVEARAWVWLVSVTEPSANASQPVAFLSELAAASLAAAGGNAQLEADLERNTGTVLVAMGEYEPALERMRRARELFRAEHGPDSLAVANTDDTIGSVMHLLGRHDEALAHHRRAATKLEHKLGPSHPYVGTALANVATELACAGELQAALQQYERAGAIVDAGLGPEHVKAAAISSNSARVLRLLDRTDEALARYERAARILAHHRGEDHPDSLRVLANAAELRVQRGELELAEAMYRRTLAGLSASLGPGHADVGIAHLNLASVLERRGAYDEATKEAATAVQVVEEALGPKHPIVIGALERQTALRDRLRAGTDQQ